MARPYTTSLQLDIRFLKGKKGKIVADTIRSAVKNEHGYPAQKGLTDSRLQKWPVVIRFRDSANRASFENNLTAILAPTVLQRMNIKHLRPVRATNKPFRFAVGM